ncbi:pyridoxal phosphate-dependent aminotransferase [Aquimarina longa]|uniref:pyridoxal phosphate-dependent aminotransferase n=1 Tax=Aquimarina longa TaxID=1080221 RepID=UPI00078336EC|nr:histidinol-phosphate transaminase [Aquimarina longa]
MNSKELLFDSVNQKNQKFDLNLFTTTTHNPSYASLTNNFNTINGLKDYCIPVNTYFPPDSVMNQLYSKIPYAIKYYPSSNDRISECIAHFSDIDTPARIITGNGSTEIISWLNSLFIKDSLFVPTPSFGRWIEEPINLGKKLHTIRYCDENAQQLTPEKLIEAVIKSGTKNLIICNPNNPTGSIFTRSELLSIMGKLQHLDNIVIDESFIDFSSINPPTVKNDVHLFPNSWVIKSLGKNVGLHGLRIGYAISNEDNISKLKKHLPYWNVNGISEMLLTLIQHEKIAYNQSRIKVIEDTKYLENRFKELHFFETFPTNSNFIFTRLDSIIDGEELRNRLMQNKSCFIRNCGNKMGSTKQYFRIAARKNEDVDFLIVAIKEEVTDILSNVYSNRTYYQSEFNNAQDTYSIS